jgi:hypothetical protein
MLKIAGELVGGGVRVAVETEKEVREVQKALPNCRFVASCGCGRFSEEGRDGVKLFQMAQKHFEETGHGAYGHFVFYAGAK